MTVGSLLSIRDLVVEFRTRDGSVRAVDGIDLDVDPGETLAVVGESGSGKTVTMLAALGLLPSRCTVSGWVLFDGRDLLALDRKQLRQIRGRHIGTVFQDPMTSLHPSLRVVDQVAEAVLVHNKGMARSQARCRALDLLAQAGVPRPDQHLNDYPHQWSGGMRQRAMIAMAIANQPRLLVADEPTTALDVTIQAQILELLRSARDEIGAATIFITHDLGVVAELADRVSVMSAGRVVETGDVGSIFATPRHEETVRLLAALPRPDRRAARVRCDGADPRLLRIENLVTHYRRSRDTVVRAVDGVSLSLSAGETLGLVGESGCGKSTLAKTVLRLVDATSGKVFFGGEDITKVDRRTLRSVRRAVSMVFQDPYSSLNPRMTVGQIISQPLRVYGGHQSGRVGELLEMVGLPASMARRRPAHLSGGERQRVAIARALALSPRLLVLDEPVSSLDASIRGHVLALLNRLQQELNLAYLFITHDLALARQICDRVAVMYLGRIVEIGSVADIFLRPTHPYTRALLSAVPVPDPAWDHRDARIVLSGEVPDPAAPPSGCRFRTRCWKATQICALQEPQLVQCSRDFGHVTACVHPEVSDWLGGSRATAAAERG